MAWPSAGLHANGFSLVRKILTRYQCPFVDELMTPTRIYVPQVNRLLQQQLSQVLGLAHITGGGLTSNISRTLPPWISFSSYDLNWKPPPIFEWLKQVGGLSHDELWNTFNMGIGMVVIVRQDTDISQWEKQYGLVCIGKLQSKS